MCTLCTYVSQLCNDDKVLNSKLDHEKTAFKSLIISEWNMNWIQKGLLWWLHLFTEPNIIHAGFLFNT